MNSYKITPELDVRLFTGTTEEEAVNYTKHLRHALVDLLIKHVQQNYPETSLITSPVYHLAALYYTAHNHLNDLTTPAEQEQTA